MKKKILSVILACIMVASVLCTAMPVFAADVTVNSGEELRAAVAAVKSGETKTIKVGSNFSIANNSKNGGNNESLSVVNGATVIIEGDNKTIDVTTDICTVEGSLTFKDLTIKLTTPMIGTAKGGSITYDGCTITQTGGRANNNKFATINADGGSFTLTDTTFTIFNGTRADSNTNVTIFKLEGATANGTVNMNNSHIKLADDAVFTKNLYAFYDSDSGSTLNVNMVNSTIGVKNTAVKAAGVVNLTMSGASSLISADNVNVVQLLGGAGAFTLKMSDNAEISNTAASEVSLLQLDKATSISMEMSGNAKLSSNGSGVALCGYNGVDKSAKPFGLTMSGNALIYAKANHAIDVFHETYEKVPATTITMSGSSKIVTDTTDKYAINLGAATTFTLNLSDTAAVTKKDGVIDGAIYKTDPPKVDTPTDGKLCRIGDTFYATLEEAYAAAADGATIVLEANVTLATTLAITKNIIIEGNGKTIDCTSADGFANMTKCLTVNNAIITTDVAIGAHRALFAFVSNLGKIVMSDVTIDLSNGNCDQYSAIFSDKNASPGFVFELSLHNVTVNTQESAPKARFLAGNAGGTLTLTGNTSIKMNGNTIINVGAISKPFNVVMEDKALLESNNGNQVIYTHSTVRDADNNYIGEANAFNLTMNDDAAVIQTLSGKNAIGLNQGARPVSLATIVLNDNAQVKAPKLGVNIYGTNTNIIINDNAVISGDTNDVEIGTGTTAPVVKIIKYTPGDISIGGNMACYTPDMADKPTMRINGSSYGLRFTSTYTAEPRFSNSKVTYGTLIATAASIANKEFTADALTAANVKFLDIKEADSCNGTSFSAAMVNIKEANYNVAFSARSYSSYTFTNATHKNTTVICYSDICTGTYADAALEQLADVKAASEVGYLNDVDACPVLDTATGKYTWATGKKYSKLNDTQYAEISAIAGKK